MKVQIRKTKIQESGSIMLEVVAVLALMGVMGAMLFRQIYQRNQELHNIQMASEIRTVKEAFSAYIQANRPAILSACSAPDEANEVEKCDFTDLYDGVREYLPGDWFSGEGELEAAYVLTLWNYKQGDGSEKRVIYGVVIPTAETLPSTGWNFRRAARVALLIGADGGAYGPGVTVCEEDGNGCIAGSLGSWLTPISDFDLEGNDAEVPFEGSNILPFYAATTGIDIFAPEYEAPEGKVGLPKNWNLVLQNLHAYGYFSVGNSDSSDGANCYTSIRHDTYTGSALNPDEIKYDLSNCRPLFWVGTETNGLGGTDGKVYVATDLNIGAIEDDGTGTIKHNEALKLTKEGEIVQKDGVTIDKDGNIIDSAVIKQKDGLTIDKDGRIIAKETVSAGIGDVASGEHFVVDPAYTSTMNDIRLTSRGGVRLSDILPNYILKEQKEFTGELLVRIPICPTHYKAAILVFPTSWDKRGLQIDISDLAGKLKGTPENLTINETTVSGTIPISEKTSNDSYTVSNDTGVCVMLYSTKEQKAYEEADMYGVINIYLGKRVGSTCESDNTARGIVQTYCVWTPSVLASESACNAAGYVWDNSKPAGERCTTGHAVDSTMNGSVVGAERSQTACERAGLTWDSTKSRCKNIYQSAATIDAWTPQAGETAEELLKRKAAACRAAGYTWNGTNCSSS